MKLQVIDLFCGIGGLTHGLFRAGIPVLAGFDSDDSCRYAYEKNNAASFYNADVKEVAGTDLLNIYGEKSIKVLVGCAPCQPFSTLAHTASSQAKNQKMNLLSEFSRLICETHPEIVSMENVPNLTKTKLFKLFVKNLKRLNYDVTYEVIYCPDYGVPQSRSRLVLLASRLGPISILPATHKKENYLTVRDTISYLPEIEAGKIDTKDLLHRSAGLSNINLNRIMQSKPGGSWRDWDESLLCECHKKSSGHTYVSVYGRMEWDKISPTITTQFYIYGTGRYGHPEQNRAISIREGALLQTFPLEYDFIEEGKPFSFSKICRHIGNAVPVRIGEIIGHSILNHINDLGD